MVRLRSVVGWSDVEERIVSRFPAFTHLSMWSTISPRDTHRARVPTPPGRLRTAVLTGVLFAWMGTAVGQELSDDVTLVTKIDQVTPNGMNVNDVHCPPGTIPTFQSAQSQDPGLSITSVPIDNHGQPVGTNVSQVAGGGYRFTARNSGVYPQGYRLLVACVPVTASSTGAFTLLPQVGTVPPTTMVSPTTRCPSGMVAVGSINPVASGLVDRGSGPVWFGPTSSLPQMLGDFADGTYPAPSGWQSNLFNETSMVRTYFNFVVCGNVLNAQTIVTSTPTLPGAKFSVFAPIPDGTRLLGAGVSGGSNGVLTSDISVWAAGGYVDPEDTVYGAEFIATSTFQSFVGAREVIFHGVDDRPKANGAKAAARAAVGVIVVPTGDPVLPPTLVNVVEFYNAALDHYFMTPVQQEINDLDTGVHKGWARTGMSFKARGLGSTGRTGRQPVCRAYGNPAAGLDSHFYSASIDECVATLAGFNGNWLLEASELFEMDLPDPVSGACPAGDVPIYRVFNNRADVNHRYTLTIAERDQMVARGYIAEGYGPDAVTLCALQ